jgi:NAD(P)-dependent dehydrogenase (short-subunit alcohol dehydrogenase family)
VNKPAQHQNKQPGSEEKMRPPPRFEPFFPGVGKLAGKVALVTGGDSGIGRAIVAAFANEGADIAVAYLNEDRDAEETRDIVKELGRHAILVRGDLGQEANCRKAVEETVREFGRLDILVNNCAEQHVAEAFEDAPSEQFDRTFRTNILSYLYTTKAALPHMKEGSVILNTASITAFKGNPVLVDYSSTKGAIVSFTRALAVQLAERKIRVNAVAPGPIWTPLIPASFDAERVAEFGTDTAMGRPGEPNEVAAAFLFLASPESAYVTGEVINVNGGTPI